MSDNITEGDLLAALVEAYQAEAGEMQPGDVFVVASTPAIPEATRIACRTHGDSVGEIVITSLDRDPDSLRGILSLVVLDHYAKQVLDHNHLNPRAARWRHAIEACNIRTARRWG